MTDEIRFIASLPPIQSAITLDGQGDGGRAKIDVSREYIQALIELQALAGQSFEVIIKPIEAGVPTGGFIGPGIRKFLAEAKAKGIEFDPMTGELISEPDSFNADDIGMTD